MAIALNQFLNQMSTNQLRTTNMFEMTITTGYSEIDAVFQGITMYVEGFTAPSRTQNYADVGFKGFMCPVATTLVEEQDHTITVRADTNGELRRAFLAWAAKTADPDIEGGSVFAGDRRLNSSSVVRLQLLDNNMSDVAEVYKLHCVKVASVGPLAMSNQDASVATFEVQLKSVFWDIENSANGALVGQK